MKLLLSVQLLVTCVLAVGAQAPAVALVPPIDPGVSQTLAKWRAERYSNVRYKVNLTLEKMSPVLKGTIEIHVKMSLPPPRTQFIEIPPIILDWRALAGHEKDSTISNITINDKWASPRVTDEGVRVQYEESNEHLIFYDGVVPGENVIRLDFTSPILTSGSATTRYIDKEDGSEYIYSLFGPRDLSTAFPVFDQPNLKARFSLSLDVPVEWKVVSNEDYVEIDRARINGIPSVRLSYRFPELRPISNYVFAFAAGNFEVFGYSRASNTWAAQYSDQEVRTFFHRRNQELEGSSIFVRKSPAAKFQPHAAETFRILGDRIKSLEDDKSALPKCDLVVIPGRVRRIDDDYLRESGIIFMPESTVFK